MARLRSSTNNQSGFLLLLVLIEGLVVLTVLTGVMTLAMYNLGAAHRSTYILDATYAAEAGADRFMYEINQIKPDTSIVAACPVGAPSGIPMTLYSNSTGRATYETCFTAGTITNEKFVYSVGKVYVPATSTTPKSIKTVRLIIEGTPVDDYTIETGPGGLVMSNSSTVSTGPIYVGGFLTMGNTSRIGSAASPVAVSVANMRCPVPVNSSWPQICPSDTQSNPITMNNSAQVYGNVQANGQTVTTGLSNPGLTSSSGVPAVTLPDYDRNSQKSAVTSTITAANASCSSSQSKTWAANVKIAGNVTLTQSCSITISGNAWITGNLDLGNSSQIKVANGIGTPPVIMIDGSSGVSLGQQSVVAANSSGVGAEFITFYSTASCSSDCSSVTGPDLNSSMAVNTINLNNQGLAASSTFYARWSGLVLGQGGNIGAILAQKITLANSGNITFGSAVSSSSSYSWDVRYYETL